MALRDVLQDFKRHDGQGARFPGERRSTAGRFVGTDSRLVHVAPDGSLADFGYPLSALTGLAHAQFGLQIDGDVTWFEDGTQEDAANRSLVRTDHRIDGRSITQRDAVVDDTHVTTFECDLDETAAETKLVAFVSFAPNGRDDRVGHLDHGDAVEAFHTDEHCFLASATGIDQVDGRVVDFADVLDPTPSEFRTDTDRYDEPSLTGDLLLSIPFQDGQATLVTDAIDENETPRAEGLDHTRTLADRFDDPSTIADAADSTTTTTALNLPPRSDAETTIATDLRVLEFLSAPGGLRIAGPEFDPFYEHSGGYGYTWFRDDAEISRYLLASDLSADLDLDEWHARSARRYCEAQRDDGTWPHRVWPFDGSIAPGWAHGRLEAGDDADYQADQTASVVSFLAAYHDHASQDRRTEIADTLADGLDGLDASLSEDGRPVVCQNAWENMCGRFTHTTATFLGAYARLAATDLGEEVTDRARRRADEVYEALDDLWVENRGVYALREREDGDVDDRYDSSTFALVDAHRAYDDLAGVDEQRRDRLVEHVQNTVEGLWRSTDAIAGLIRFEGDDWRTGTQDREKVWTVSTGAGAHACAELATLLERADDDRAGDFDDRARQLLEPLSFDGSLCIGGGYLPEQFYDDGTPDSATPLGWSHAIRLATTVTLADRSVPATAAGGD